MKNRSSNLTLVLALALASGCAKKDPKPVHTEPWLAHPPASASATPDAALPSTRYVLTQESVIHLELSTKRGKLSGKLTKVTGELTVALGALAQSRGQVRAELDSLALDDDNADSAAWLASAKSALGLTDGGASPVAVFDVTSLEDTSPEALPPLTAAAERPGGSDAGAGVSRHARAAAVGDLLLNGFRVQKRAPLEVEFKLGPDRSLPAGLSIRSRAPLVISLATHELHLRDPSAAPRHNPPPPAARDLRVSVELYATKP